MQLSDLSDDALNAAIGQGGGLYGAPVWGRGELAVELRGDTHYLGETPVLWYRGGILTEDAVATAASRGMYIQQRSSVRVLNCPDCGVLVLTNKTRKRCRACSINAEREAVRRSNARIKAKRLAARPSDSCDHCGKLLPKADARKRYCDAKCKQAAYRRRRRTTTNRNGVQP